MHKIYHFDCEVLFQHLVIAYDARLLFDQMTPLNFSLMELTYLVAPKYVSSRENFSHFSIPEHCRVFGHYQ